MGIKRLGEPCVRLDELLNLRNSFFRALLFEEFRLHLFTHALCRAKSGLREFLVPDPDPEVVVGVIPLQTGPPPEN